MSNQCGTFLQIHYHARPGGVTTVMRAYARAARRIWGDQLCTALLCSDSAEYSEFDHTWTLAECGYRHFDDAEAFATAHESLSLQLYQLLRGRAQPVCVVGHNLTLGKNPALSAAFSTVAQQLTQEGFDIRFFSVIHDLAEDGRVVNVASLDALAHQGVPIWDSIYSLEAPVRFITISEATREHLAAAGITASLLPNPVDPIKETVPLDNGTRKEIADALARLAANEGTQFNPAAPTFFYPVRVIRRKNVFEAAIAACLFCHANLVLGSPGTAAEDRALFSRLHAAAQRRKLPIVMNFPRIAASVSSSLRQQPLIHLLTRFADAVISTAVTEGFGYALYEPWSCLCPVIGRRPAGFRPAGSLSLDHLYDCFPVPADLVDLDQLTRAYATRRRELLDKSHSGAIATPDEHPPLAALVSDGQVDYGMLDVDEQMKIFDRLGQDSEAAAKILQASRFAVCHQWEQFSGMAGTDLCRQNRRVIQRDFGPAAFDKNFASVFSHRASESMVCKKRLDQIRLRLVSFEYLRLLTG